MEAHLPPSPPPSSPPPARRRYPPLFWVLLALLVLLLVVGIGSLTAYFVLDQRQPQVSPQAAAWEQLDGSRVSAGLAVWALTDIEPAQVYRQAMSANELESAVMTAITMPALDDLQRIGWLAVVARRQATLGDKARAQAYTTWTGQLVFLGPALSDWQRLQTLQELSDIWIKLADQTQAENILVQMRYGVQASAELSPTVRRQFLQAIADRYRQLGLNTQARTVAAAEVSASPEISGTLPAIDSLSWLRAPLPPDEDVRRFRAARVAEAQRFMDSWLANQGQVERSQVESLAGTLLDEDIARQVYYQRYLGTEGLDADLRLALQWDRVQWLILKYRVADGLYGQPLVSNWQADLPAIRQTLSEAFTDLIDLMLARTDDMPPQEQAAARGAVLRRALMWAILGQYPDADTAALVEDWQQSTAELERGSGLWPYLSLDATGQLRVSWTPEK